MKITSKIIALILVVSIVIIVVGNWIFGIFFKSYLLEQENNQIKTNVQNIQSNLHEVQIKYEAIARDWGHWDETYHFVNKNNAHYVKLNLSAESFANINTNLMVFYNQENAIFHKVNVDLEKEAFIPFPDSLTAELDEFKNAAQKKDRTGIIKNEDKYYIISLAAITDSLEEKPSIGTFLVGKLIDASMVEELQKITGSEITFLSKDDNALSKELPQSANIENGAYSSIYNDKKDEITTSVLLSNLDNSAPTVVVRMTKGRDFYMNGMARLFFLQVVYSLFVFIIILLLLLFLRFYVSKPINKLSHLLNHINISKNKLEKLPIPENTEFSFIFGAINNLLSRIEVEREKFIESEKRAKMAQAIANVGNWELDLKTKNIWASEQSFIIYGIASESDELPLELVQSLVFDEDRQKLDDALKRLLSGQGTYDVEFKIHRLADGKERYINSKAELVCDEEGNPMKVLGVIYDITSQKKANESLVDSEIKQKTMIANISDVIAIMGVDGTIQYISSNVTKYFGWLPEEITNTNAWARVHPDDIARLQEEFKRMIEKEGEAKTVQYRFKCKDGTYKDIELTGKNLLNDKTINGFLMNYHDITQRKENEELMLYNSYHDSLTGLYNRRFFDEEIEKLEKENTTTTIIVGDLNGLKLANDAYGHSLGDTMLKKIAEIIYEECGEKGCVARVGGDEFGIILPNIHYDEAYVFIRNIKKRCEKESKDELILAISFGLSTNKDEKLNLNECYNLAEDRMYTSKLLEGKSAKSKVIDNLRVVMEERTGETQKHCERIAVMSQIIGSEMGLHGFEIEHLKLLALLHDIGKTAIPDSILLKPGKLDDAEIGIMKKHCEIGFRIANTMPELLPIAEGILYHHERWDGNGYPMGLKGDKIPKISRIIALLDAYDAMTNNRPYREAMSVYDAVEEIKRCAGTQFDPYVVQVFIEKALKIAV